MAKTDWGRHIEAWQGSGLSQAAYCRQEGLSAAYFSQRLRAYRAAPVVGAQALMPVRVEPAAPAAGSLLLHCGQAQRLELPSSVSPRWVAELLPFAFRTSRRVLSPTSPQNKISRCCGMVER